MDSVKEHPQLRAMHMNEERRAVDRQFDSPVAMGHPLAVGSIAYGPVDMNAFGNPRDWHQQKVIREREAQILAQEIASGKVKVSPTETPFNSKLAKASPNPKQAFGDKKPPVHLIHSIAALHESAALHSGKRKYGENNYLESPVEAMTYVGAIKRHLDQWVSGERVDQKELVHHLGAIRACTNILLSAEACGTLIDNRPRTVNEELPFDGRRPPSYQEATQETFAEVERTIEHLNKLYPTK